MSGLALAAGTPPAGPKRTEGRAKEDGGGLMGSLRIIEIQLVAFAVMFSTSGLVPLLDKAFLVLITDYIFLLDALVFEGSGNLIASKEVFRGSGMFQLYVALSTIVGPFLPLAYVLGGFARGDQKAVRMTALHLLLLSAQVLSENVISSVAVFSLPVRAILPFLYTGRHLFTLCDWV